MNGSPIPIEGDARLESVRDGKRCNMTFVDVAVRRPLTSVSAMSTEATASCSVSKICTSRTQALAREFQ